MTENEKQLLLKDLCARLPYGVICTMWDETEPKTVFTEKLIMAVLSAFYENSWYGMRPYLRPMSSMTEEEKEELKYAIELELQALEGDEGHSTVSAAPAAFEIDFYNKHHLDYRGLIEKGLALEAKEGMYD